MLLLAVDSYDFAQLPDGLKESSVTGKASTGTDPIIEFKPPFHEWATIQPGMITLARKKRTATWRSYTAAETAVPVIGCAAGLALDQERNFYFAGVARSKSVREPDDGIGPKTDEFFTVSIGGMVTVLNTSGAAIHPGDLVGLSHILLKLVASVCC